MVKDEVARPLIISAVGFSVTDFGTASEACTPDPGAAVGLLGDTGWFTLRSRLLRPLVPYGRTRRCWGPPPRRLPTKLARMYFRRIWSRFFRFFVGVSVVGPKCPSPQPAARWS